LRRAKRDTEAKRLKADGGIHVVSAEELRRGDLVLVETGDFIPGDGEIVEGLASIDESAITGESAPVIKRAGSDQSSVTGGTRVTSDSILIKITTNPGDSFLDRMIALIEGAKRQKAPNEIALNTVLIVFTLIFLIVVVTLVPIAAYAGIHLNISVLVVLLVCLIPTTIGGLLSAIGIAGMDRVTRFGVIAMSGKAVEAAGDVNTIILDKTGTITYGNRLAAQFVPVAGAEEKELIEVAVLTSLFDDTPEGSSILMLAKQKHVVCDVKAYEGQVVPFTAEERMSGLNYRGVQYRKGAVRAICDYVGERQGTIPKDLKERSAQISRYVQCKREGTKSIHCVLLYDEQSCIRMSCDGTGTSQSFVLYRLASGRCEQPVTKPSSGSRQDMTRCELPSTCLPVSFNKRIWYR
jgi:K+-transporting ATPase ATPase B chain